MGESGTIVVNHVLASNYISMTAQQQQKSSTSSREDLFMGIPFVPMQWIAHSSQAPHRLICKLSSSQKFCNDETYDTETGISNWVYGLYIAAKWILARSTNHTLLISLLVVPIILLLAFVCSLMETFVVHVVLRLLPPLGHNNTTTSLIISLI